MQVHKQDVRALLNSMKNLFIVKIGFLLSFSKKKNKCMFVSLRWNRICLAQFMHNTFKSTQFVSYWFENSIHKQCTKLHWSFLKALYWNIYDWCKNGEKDEIDPLDWIKSYSKGINSNDSKKWVSPLQVFGINDVRTFKLNAADVIQTRSILFAHNQYDERKTEALWTIKDLFKCTAVKWKDFRSDFLRK